MASLGWNCSAEVLPASALPAAAVCLFACTAEQLVLSVHAVLHSLLVRWPAAKMPTPHSRLPTCGTGLEAGSSLTCLLFLLLQT